MKSNDINYSKTCPFVKILPIDSCPLSNESGSKTVCKSNAIDKNKGRGEDKLNSSNFDESGLLIADTKFNQSHSYEMVDPLIPKTKLEWPWIFKNISKPRIMI